MALPSLITKNFGLKCLSFALAFITWKLMHWEILNAQDVPVTQTLKLPIDVFTPSSDSRSFRILPSEVAVTISAMQSIMKNFNSTNLQVFVNLINVQLTNGLKRRIEVACPSGITLVRVQPTEVQLDVPPQPKSLKAP
jgi:hypothetical protein